MKLRMIGVSGPVFDGVILSPDGRGKHPEVHPMYIFSRPTLFVRDAAGLTSVLPDRSAGWAMLDATEAEREQLKGLGYRMLNL